MSAINEPHVERLGREECLEYLASAKLGRIGLTVRALPAIVPIRFALAGGDVVFRAPSDSELRQRAKDSVVAFQADHHGDDTGIAWTVQAQGLCQEVDHPREIERLQELPLPTWRAGPPGDSWLRLPLQRLTGQRIYW